MLFAALFLAYARHARAGAGVAAAGGAAAAARRRRAQHAAAARRRAWRCAGGWRARGAATPALAAGARRRGAARRWPSWRAGRVAGARCSARGLGPGSGIYGSVFFALSGLSRAARRWAAWSRWRCCVRRRAARRARAARAAADGALLGLRRWSSGCVIYVAVCCAVRRARHRSRLRRCARSPALALRRRRCQSPRRAAAPFTAPLTLGGRDRRAARRSSTAREVYTHYCRPCHGDAGDGKGTAAAGLRPPPRDLRLGVYKFAAVAGRPAPERRRLRAHHPRRPARHRRCWPGTCPPPSSTISSST